MTEIESILLIACFGMMLGRLIGELLTALICWIMERRAKKSMARQNKVN